MKVETDTYIIERIASKEVLQRASEEGERVGRVQVNRITDKRTGYVTVEEVKFWYRNGKLTRVT